MQLLDTFQRPIPSRYSILYTVDEDTIDLEDFAAGLFVSVGRISRTVFQPTTNHLCSMFSAVARKLNGQTRYQALKMYPGTGCEIRLRGSYNTCSLWKCYPTLNNLDYSILVAGLRISILTKERKKRVSQSLCK